MKRLIIALASVAMLGTGCMMDAEEQHDQKCADLGWSRQAQENAGDDHLAEMVEEDMRAEGCF